MLTIDQTNVGYGDPVASQVSSKSPPCTTLYFRSSGEIAGASSFDLETTETSADPDLERPLGKWTLQMYLPESSTVE